MSATQDIVVDAFRVESLPESETGRGHGVLCRGVSHRDAGLDQPAHCFLVSAFEGTGIARSSAWMWGYVTMAALVLVGTFTALAASEPEQSARAEAATSGRERIYTRDPRRGRGVLGISHSKGCARGACLRGAVKFTDAFSGTMTAPFVIDLGFSRNDYAAIVKGVGLAATLIGGFAGGIRRAALFTGREPVDRRAYCRRSPTCRSPGLRWSASINGRSPLR